MERTQNELPSASEQKNEIILYQPTIWSGWRYGWKERLCG